MSDVKEATRGELCAVALAECFRGDGEILASAIGVLPTLGARLAKLTFAPEILITDGLHFVLENPPPLGAANGFEPVVEAWLPYRSVFDWLWAGRRHVVMGATQIDRFGNQNIACIGDPKQPRAQLLGMRGAPGNTINHPTSYWVPNHGPKSFVAKVDVVSGVGYDRAAALGPRASRFHEIRRVVSNLGVFDFRTRDHAMRLASVHPGVTLDEVVEKTGFPLVIEEPAVTRSPTAEELRLLRERLDPAGVAAREPLG
jgi:acyl CoA:acetate/3-ketoacid CoA transferase beta subunit